MDASRLAELGPFAIGLAVLGLVWGLAADRVSARWPPHPDAAVRPADWRTGFVAIAAALAFGALPLRFDDARDVAVLAVWFAALVLLMATDLDQRLLPDQLTLTLIPIVLAALLLGWDPLLAHKDLGVASGLAAAIVAPLFLGITGVLFRGALGFGDLKLAVSLGLAAGLSRFISGFVLATLAASAVLLVLVAARRLKLRSVIPFGPILIGAGILAALLGQGW